MTTTTRKLHNNMYLVEDESGKRLASVSGRMAERVASRIAELYNSGQVSNENELARRILNGNKG